MGRPDEPRKAWQQTGVKVLVPEEALSGARLARAVEALPLGEHLWVCVTIHRVDPERMLDPEHTTYFDNENLLQGGATGCLVCEGPYELVKDRPCRGGGGAW
ncbi:hypothetical protein GCM10009530_26700 [Microbispora corallina]|uniref:Uncharacterized protein n=1 Tax=Microbispora corallina TaxID=83302 RepID=A0ABQ4G505_9ACTN|nr:hypothetical protein [Microbispora corallina]GIH42151.1 hypothetical protein Mco01_51510 [Microbispora corallina]